MASPKVQFRPNKELLAELAARVDVSVMNAPDSQRDVWLSHYVEDEVLHAYFYFLNRSIPQFSENEALFLFDMLNGHVNQPETAHLLSGIIADHVLFNGADSALGEALQERVRSLTPFEQWALLDAVKRAWNAPTYYITNTREVLWKAGIVSPETLSDILSRYEAAQTKIGTFTLAVKVVAEKLYRLVISSPTLLEEKKEEHASLEALDGALGGERQDHLIKQAIWQPVFLPEEEEQ